MADSGKKVTIALVGGGAANAGLLRTLSKQSNDIKNLLDVVIIDSQDYHSNPASLQRLLAHPEKAPFSQPSWSELQKNLGGWTRFIHGHVASISSKNKVVLSDGSKVKFDYAVVATGSEYLSHPWLNPSISALLDTAKKSALAKAFKSDLSDEETSIRKSFEDISEMAGVEWAIVSDFLSHASSSSSADLLRLHAALSNADKYENIIESLKKKSKAVKKFLKSNEFDSDDASLIRDAISDALSKEIRLWGSRGLFREHVSDGELRSLQWRNDQINLESQSIARADSVLILGGGEVSIETAADIIERYPNKKVTILHNGPEILERTKSNRAHKNLHSFFKKRGVELILGESVKAWRPIGSRYAVETSSGKVLNVSKIIVGFGCKPRNAPFKKDFAKSIDELTGRVTVDAHLRLTDKIFVLGDVSSADRMNAYVAGVQGELTAKNLIASIQGHSLSMLVLGDTCIIAGTGAFGMKDKTEAKLMKDLGATIGIDKKWTKEFSKITKSGSVSSSTVDA